ncbi:hypothetical protein ABZP36_011883 [Zizania latifolia]
MDSNPNSENKEKDNVDFAMDDDDGMSDDDGHFNIPACYYQSDKGNEEVTSGGFEGNMIDDINSHLQHTDKKLQ